MKFVVVCAVLAVIAFLVSAESAFDPDIMRVVNTHPQSKWRAGINKFASMNLEEVKAMLGAQVPKYERYTEAQMKIIGQKQAPSNNPSSFDSRDKWPQCIHPIRDQAHCGSCWAFSGTEALSDRFCIASQGKINVVLSPQDPVSCNWYNQGCNGGILPLVWEYFKATGVVPDKCLPYTSQNGTVEACPSTCVDGKTDFNSQKYKLASWSKVSPSVFIWEREQKIEDALLSSGPVQTGFSVYQDFLQYTSGVYHHITGSFLGGHAVKIVGYGVTQDGVKYWIVANSWGESWGIKGFFWIKKGNNECGIEGDVYDGVPDVNNVPTPMY